MFFNICCRASEVLCIVWRLKKRLHHQLVKGQGLWLSDKLLSSD